MTSKPKRPAIATLTNAIITANAALSPEGKLQRRTERHARKHRKQHGHHPLYHLGHEVGSFLVPLCNDLAPRCRAVLWRAMRAMHAPDSMILGRDFAGAHRVNCFRCRSKREALHAALVLDVLEHSGR
jgi:hypothetical protein